jgi:hypothetical protein
MLTAMLLVVAYVLLCSRLGQAIATADPDEEFKV